MALKSTIYKASVQLSDMDRHVYGNYPLTLALHPSETEERLMVRVLAFALNLPADDKQGSLTFAKGLSDTDEPDLWHKDLTDQVLHWIDLGQPDERRMSKACGRAGRVSVYAFAGSTPVWFAGLQNKITRLRNLTVWQVPADQSQALASMAQRAMQLQVTVQDGQVWVSDDRQTVEVQPKALWTGQAGG